ncbi:hypothetical protein J8L73_02940 [Pseudoalteromonas sp. MMG006]|uniref:DUF6864 domain-containing function n=1 Tax=Pseudoalteromonas sp. MMG006 TaxID=2822683 RepID=UPI001B35B10D|nr:hypothetical protein [Pseudoalteromonas sp. MMG006]MBQ4798104.1 hypothetical protein [Pseudoalteromonas sp. MMG006]
MEKIGNRKLVYSQNFIVPEGERVDITSNLEGWNLRIVIAFDPKGSEQGVTIKPIDDYALITFIKWDNSLGTCTSKPLELGTHHKGNKLFFSATNYCISGTNKLTFQLLMGDDNV